MIGQRSSQEGFTAVELLITLFVAAAFLIAGYQLFSVVIKDGGESRAESRASNVASDYMRRYTASTTNPCQSSANILPNTAINVNGLANVLVSVSITCPSYGATPSLSKVEATVTYNSPQKTVKQSTYVNGGSSVALDVTDGLVGWWKFNGNANTDIGSVNGVVSNATLTTGQNGQPNSAYAFNGTSGQYITLNSTFGLATTNITLSAWMYTASATNSGAILKIGGAGYGIGMGGSTFENTTPGSKLIGLFEAVRWFASTSNISSGWHHVLLTIDNSGVPTLYYDGTTYGTYAGTPPQPPGSGVTTIGGTPGRNFNGSIDDVRIYNRTLTGGEVTNLYSGGAK